MTSASGLYSNHLRSRSGPRNPNPNPNPNQPNTTLPSDLHRNPRPCRIRRHGDNGGPSRHRLLGAEHKLLQSDSSNPKNNSRTGNSSNSRTGRSRVNELALIRSGEGNERLPGTVLQAQARLLERLRGISLTGSRQNITASHVPQNITASNAPQNEFVAESDFGIIHSGDWEIEASREWLESDIQFTGLTADTNQAMSFHYVSKKKPPGLSQEAICSLPQENFQDAQENDGVTSASLECSICLEKFRAGDVLFLLPCYHRFHCPCLETWLQSCGNCPYCRASI